MGIVSTLLSLIFLVVPVVVVVGVVMLIVRGYTNKNPNGKRSEEDGAIMNRKHSGLTKPRVTISYKPTVGSTGLVCLCCDELLHSKMVGG